MKKYEGRKNWYETLYHFSVDEDDFEYAKESGEDYGNLKPGDTMFYLYSPPFHEYDKNSLSEFNIVFSGFEDTNLFITDTEYFNWLYRHRI